MGEKILCPLCKKVESGLWPLIGIPDEQRVALKLMEVEAICYRCWEEHMAQLRPEVMLEVLMSLMDEYTGLMDEHIQLEESTKEEIEGLEKGNEELTEALEDLKGRISDVLR